MRQCARGHVPAIAGTCPRPKEIYLKSACPLFGDINMTARDALAAGVWDARQIYRADGFYTPQIRSSLQDVIKLNKTNHPTIFVKEGQ